MKINEKFFIGTVAVSIAILAAAKFLRNGVIYALGFYFLTLIALIAYYFYYVKSSLLRIVLGLLIAQVVATSFQLLHLPGGTQLTIIGLLGTLLFAYLIARRNFKGSGKNIYYVLAIALFTQSALYLSGLEQIGGLLNYLVVALIGTLKLRGEKIDSEIDKVLNIYLLTGIANLLVDTINNNR